MTARGVPGAGTESNPHGMAPLTPAAQDIGQTDFDPTAGWESLVSVLVALGCFAIAVLVAFAVGAWASSRAAGPAEGEIESSGGALLP